MIKRLASIHTRTEEVFAHYGHIFFFAPMAIDHIGTFWGNLNALAFGTYAIIAFAYRASDG